MDIVDRYVALCRTVDAAGDDHGFPFEIDETFQCRRRRSILSHAAAMSLPLSTRTWPCRHNQTGQFWDRRHPARIAAEDRVRRVHQRPGRGPDPIVVEKGLFDRTVLGYMKGIHSGGPARFLIWRRAVAGTFSNSKVTTSTA